MIQITFKPSFFFDATGLWGKYCGDWWPCPTEDLDFVFVRVNNSGDLLLRVYYYGECHSRYWDPLSGVPLSECWLTLLRDLL